MKKKKKKKKKANQGQRWNDSTYEQYEILNLNFKI